VSGSVDLELNRCPTEVQHSPLHVEIPGIPPSRLTHDRCPRAQTRLQTGDNLRTCHHARSDPTQMITPDQIQLHAGIQMPVAPLTSRKLS